jgi:outer membrane protein OmpA-like peptidoglycan-associated protein
MTTMRTARHRYQLDREGWAASSGIPFRSKLKKHVFVPPDLEEDYVTRYKAESDVHFDLGSATLSQEARDILGFMAASELAAMRHRGSELRLIGTADRVDVEWYNKSLSKMRAENALQALVDALGPHLRVSTETHGLGEDYAKLLGDPDKKPNPEARRVFVRLDGRTIATLRGSQSV